MKSKKKRSLLNVLMFGTDKQVHNRKLKKSGAFWRRHLPEETTAGIERVSQLWKEKEKKKTQRQLLCFLVGVIFLLITYFLIKNNLWSIGKWTLGFAVICFILMIMATPFGTW